MVFQKNELNDDQELFKLMISSARDAIVLTDNVGNIIYLNKATEDLFGYNSDEAVGKNIHNLVVSQDVIALHSDKFKELSKNKNQDPFEYHTLEFFIHKNTGEVFPIEITTTPIMYKGKLYFSGIIRDISEKKKIDNDMKKVIEELRYSKDIVEQNSNELISLNSKLAESQERLSELNASKDKFFSIISHDLKNPFQALLGFSEVLSKEIYNLSKEEIVVFVTDLNETANQVFKLLENLLQWSRLQRGVIEFLPSEFQLNQLVELNINLLKPIAKQKKITIESQINPKLLVLADLNMINTVLRNLISNAIKFTPIDGKITLHTSYLNKNRIYVNVHDNGIGMTEQDCSKLFRIDCRYSTQGTINEKGTGLGLILCKELIDMHAEKLFVNSELGKGSTFTFTLKLAE